LIDFLKKSQISNIMKIHPVGAELFHADGQMDMTILIALFLAVLQMQLKRQNVRSLWYVKYK